MKLRAALASLLLASAASALAVFPASCSSDDASDDLASGSDSGTDATNSGDSAPLVEAGTPRAFRLASGGVQLLVTGPAIGFQITPAELAADVDVLEVHQEYYGTPWDAFAAGTAPPAEWTAQMQAIADAAHATNKPIFLSITMLNGERDSLAAQTTIQNGKVQSTDHWAAHCYDFATAADAASMKAAYLAYVDTMVAMFQPAYLNMAVEVNLFFENCPAAVAGMVSVANAAYDEAKKKQADLIVFPSIQIDHLYGVSDTCAGGATDAGAADACFAANYAQIAPLKRDRFAMSSYPQLGSYKKASDLPSDWFSRGASKNGEVGLIAETGWNSRNLVAELKSSTCYTVFTNTEADEAAYLDFVLQSAESQKIDVVNWWSDRDLVTGSFMTDCPCAFDATWCAVRDVFRGPAPPADAGAADPQFFGEVLAKAFGSMGLRNYDGSMKPTVYGHWQAALARPLSK
ncbi:MAG: hypothetical protein ABI461_21625 [Polyangiaceae bacterium]